MFDYPMFDLLAVSNHVHYQIMGTFAWFDMWLCYKDMYHVIYTLHLLFYLFKSDKMRWISETQTVEAFSRNYQARIRERTVRKLKSGKIQNIHSLPHQTVVQSNTKRTVLIWDTGSDDSAVTMQRQYVIRCIIMSYGYQTYTLQNNENKRTVPPCYLSNEVHWFSTRLVKFGTLFEIEPYDRMVFTGLKISSNIYYKRSYIVLLL